ncbi:MAG: hypothetical protein WB646_01090 [Steroidobacteraceae bacterium]
MRENVPEHVAPSLVYDFDIWNMSPECPSPLHHWNTLRERDAPRIFYTPRNGGHWVLHHFEDTLEGYRDTTRTGFRPATLLRTQVAAVRHMSR